MSKRSYHVTLDISALTSEQFETWSNTDINSADIIPRGVDGNGEDCWWVAARNGASASRKAEAEIARTGLPVTISTCAERL